MVNRSRYTEILAAVMCLLTAACYSMQKVEDTVFAKTPQGTVSLHSVDDSWFRTAHPVSVSPLILAHVLQGVQVQTAPGEQTTAERVFSDEETAFLSQLMSTALSKAAKSQLVSFRVIHDSGSGSEMTGGLLFTRGRLLHLWLTHYRVNGASNDSSTTLDRQARNPQGLTPRQLRFVPEMVQRSGRNQQPDLIDPPPLATLVIDYTMLAASLNLPSEVPLSQPVHVGSSPNRQADTPSTSSDHGVPTVKDVPSSTEGETEALKELVRKQAVELDALKEDMRVLRNRLSEMSAPSSSVTKPPTVPR